LKNVSFENFLSLLEVCAPRVNLQISNVDIFNLDGAMEAREEEGFIDRLMKTRDSQVLIAIQKQGYKIEGEDWQNLIQRTIDDGQALAQTSLLSDVTED
jgi:hypothetical protein